MKKLLQLVSAAVLFAGCSSSKIELPDYIKDCSSIYDDETYLCATGEGSTKEQAKINAAVEISRRLKTKITSEAKIETLITDTDGKPSVKETHSNVNLIQTDFEFTDLNYTEIFKSGESYFVTAYIERKKAWEQFNAKLLILKGTFLELCRNAETADPLSSLIYLEKAEFLVPELSEKINILYAISPALTEEKYSDCRKKISGLAGTKASVLKSCTVYIPAIKEDYASVIYSQLVSSFKKAGLTPVTSESAVYKAKVSLNLNMTKEGPEDDPVLCAMPSVNLEIIYDEKTVSAFSASVQEKTLAFTEEKLKRESLRKLAQKIDGTFSRQSLSVE